MKAALLNLVVFLGVGGFASIAGFGAALASSFNCIEIAEKAAAKYCKTPLWSFQEGTDLIHLCRPAVNPSSERIYFGDGSVLVGVFVSTDDEDCDVTNVFIGQDDQDFDYGDCLDE